jgi:hypothetical protein
VRSTGSRASRRQALGVRHGAGLVPPRDRVASAPANEARTRSRRSGPSVDESKSLYGQRSPAPDCRTDSRTFRGAAASAVGARRWESTRRAAWPPAPAVSRSLRSAAPATAATSTVVRSAPASPAATAAAARGGAIGTVPKVVWITGITSARDASAAGRPACAWGITVPPLRLPPPVCPPRSGRPRRMLRSRLFPRLLGPRPGTVRFVAGGCASARPSAGPSAGSCPPARVSTGEGLL